LRLCLCNAKATFAGGFFYSYPRNNINIFLNYLQKYSVYSAEAAI